MQLSLAVSTFLMGVAGGPHCIAMCGAACAGLQQGEDKYRIWHFHAGRILGYASLGAVAASSVGALAWFSDKTMALKPLWTFFHVAVLAWGIILLLFARQPLWIEQLGRQLWQSVKQLANLSTNGLLTGMLWALMPCGLLYSALLVASLNADAISGAISMATFAIGTSLSLLVGPAFWLKLKNGIRFLGDATSMRLAGLLLAGVAGWAVWMDVMHQTKVWCN